jgi:hypothetical protein
MVWHRLSSAIEFDVLYLPHIYSIVNFPALALRHSSRLLSSDVYKSQINPLPILPADFGYPAAVRLMAIVAAATPATSAVACQQR